MPFARQSNLFRLSIAFFLFKIEIMEKHEQDRAKILLKATLDILTKCENSPTVLDVSSQTAFWDDTECDGNCLREEIEELLFEIETPDQLKNDSY